MLKDRQKVLLDENTIIVSETDAKGIITYANEDFCKICGYVKDTLIGNNHSIVRHPDMPEVVFKGLWETIKSGDVWHGIVKNRTRSGGYYWVKATIYTSIENGITRYFSVRVKPTEKQIKEAELLYSKLN